MLYVMMYHVGLLLQFEAETLDSLAA